MKKILSVAIVIPYVTLIAGCGGRSATKTLEPGHAHTEDCIDSHQEHSHDQETAEDEIIFPAAQAAKVGLEVEVIGLSAFREVIRTSGDIVAAQGDAWTITAPVAGIVSFPQANLAQGRPVGKGETLFHVSSRSVAGGDAADRARVAYESARAAYERAEKLLPDNIVSQREYDEIRRQYLDAKNEWEALAAGSTGNGSAVRSPSAGYITSLAVSEGEFAEVGQTLAVVSRNTRQQLVARVPERYFALLPKIRSANIVSADGETVPLVERNGRLISVGRSLESGSTLIPVTFEFDAHPAVIPGSIVEVYLLGAERDGVLVVPAGALTESQGSYFVYEQVDADGYVRHPVVTGATDGERVEIVSGIGPGLRIVTHGAVHVRMATTSAIPHSHEH